MHPILRNILALIAGVFIGSIINMGLITISGNIIPLPEGVDPNDMESIKNAIPNYAPKHFIFPFLAHALGTLGGAFVTAKLAANNAMKFATGIGVFFLLGGIAAVAMLGGPLWFIALDLLGAYIPMGYLGGKLSLLMSRKN